MFGTDLTVIFDSEAVTCQPSSVSADCETSCRFAGTGWL
jgi:hypothetical protein